MWRKMVDEELLQDAELELGAYGYALELYLNGICLILAPFVQLSIFN